MNRLVVGPRDDGFTLAEVLVAVVIEALVVGALSMAFIGILRGTSQVNQSLSQSGDARIAAAYFANDASNSSGPEISLTDVTSCADPSPPVAGTAVPVVRFDSTVTNSTGATEPVIVIYSLVSNTGVAPFSFVRRECENGALVSDQVLASSLASVLVTCSPSVTPQCGGTPISITALMTETPASNGVAYQYSLTGTFEKLIGGGAPANSVPPQSVLTLGSGTNCTNGGTGISLTASASMVVYGAVYVNSVNNACKALSMTSNATYQAGSTSMITGGTCASTTGASACPSYTSYSPALTDPYAGLATPTLTGTAQSGCSGGIAQPGVYANTLSISGTSCQLAAGIYILNDGLSVTNSGVLTSASGGVLLYIAGGSVSSASAGSIAASAQTTGAYKGIVVWEPATNVQPVSFASSGNVALAGILYAPKANVNISTTAPNPTITSVVSQTIWMASGNIVIGTPSTTPLSIAAPSTLPAWTVNNVYPATTFTAAGGDGNYSWSATNLPAGLSITPTSGFIYGTPTTAGTSSVTVSLNDDLGDNTASRTYSLTVNAAPSVLTASLPTGDKSAAYTTTLAGSGGTTPYSWSATGLPAGLSLSTAGVISGTPTGSGTSTVALTLTDTASATATATLSLAINAAPSIVTASLPTGEKSAAYTTTLAGSGGTTPYSWSATGLPAGLSLSTAGVISGTPTGSGTSTVALTLTDTASATATATLSLAINAAPSIVTASLPTGEKSAAYTTTLAGSGGTTPYSWSATGLPAGLSLSTAGVISGTPTGSGTSTVALTLTDTASATATANLPLTVNTVTGPPTQLVFVTAPQVIEGSSGTIILQEQDGLGNPVDAAAALNVSLSSGSTHLTFSPSASVTIAAGTSTATFTTSDTTDTAPETVTASATGLQSATQSEAIHTAAADSTVTVGSQSGSLSPNGTTTFAVQVKNTGGNGHGYSLTNVGGLPAGATWASSASCPIIAGGDTSTFTLTVTTTAATPANVSAYAMTVTATRWSDANDCNVSGGIYEEAEGAGSLTVNPATAAQLAFAVQPDGATSSGGVFPVQPKVAIEDADGNVAVSASASVTLTLNGTGTLGGCTSAVNTTNGIATFSGCKVTGAVDILHDTLTATASAGLASTVMSAPFNITGAASKLVFSSQPLSDTGTGALSSQPIVAVEDASGNLVTASSPSITLVPSVNAITCPRSSATVVASDGSATFGACAVTTARSGYTLTASSSGLTSATSASFNVTVSTPTISAPSSGTPQAFAVTQTETFTTTGTNLAYGATVVDSGGHLTIDGWTWLSSTQISITVTCTSAGTDGLIITNPDGGSVTASSSLT